MVTIDSVQVALETLADLHDKAVSFWHQGQDCEVDDPLLSLIVEQHGQNYELWHLEDFARRDDVPDREIVAAKRAIDRTNQRRNDLIEQLDSVILGLISLANGDAPLHSETLGMMVDRMSILSLKIYHTEQELTRDDVPTEHISKNAARLKILVEQRADLEMCLLRVWSQALKGEVQVKMHRQLKMYNDPELNPELYRTSSGRLDPGGVR